MMFGAAVRCGSWSRSARPDTGLLAAPRNVGALHNLLFRTDAVQVLVAPQEQSAAAHRGRPVEYAGVVLDPVVGQEFKLGFGGHHVGAPVPATCSPCRRASAYVSAKFSGGKPISLPPKPIPMNKPRSSPRSAKSNTFAAVSGQCRVMSAMNLTLVP